MNIELQSEALQHFPLAVTELSPGWQCVVLADISATVSPGFASGKHSSDGSGIPHLRPMNVDRDGNIDLNVVKSVVSTEGIELAEGDVLFNNTNSAELIGKTALISMREKGYAYSNHMTRIRPESGIASRYVALQLHFLWIVGYAKHRCTNHVNQASISSQTLAKTIPFLLPPAAEQTRIVAKLEELLSDLDAGVAELKAAQKKLGQYRQSLLKAAVEGALTAEWRAAQHAGQTGKTGKTAPFESGAALLARILTERRSRWEARQLVKFQSQGKPPPKDWQTKYPAPVAPDTTGLPALPLGWVWASIDQLSPDDLANGRSVQTAEIGAKVLRLTSVKRGQIDLSECKTGAWSADEAKPFAVVKGDLLIVRGNGSLTLVGRAGMVPVVTEQVAYPDTMIRLRVVDSVVRPEWVGLLWDASITRRHIEMRARTSAGIYKISQPDIVTVVIPVPPLNEQDQMLSMFKQVGDEMQLVQSMVDHGLKQSAAQRKNILQAAFSGQLVSQDPADEPASVLLARIRAERAARETGAARGRGEKKWGDMSNKIPQGQLS